MRLEKDLSLSKKELEVITLKVVYEMINEMVNHSMMIFNFNDPNSTIMFETSVHRAYFNILLVDFLSVPKKFFIEKKGFLERLSDICKDPKLLGRENIKELEKAVSLFRGWLDKEVTIEKRWFPSIDLEIDLKIKREDFIKICGNITKHNFTQRTIQASKFQEVLQNNGQNISVDRCLIALEDFHEQFTQDIMIYHSNTLAEFLNNIRWGVYTYAKHQRAACVVNWYDKDLGIQSYKYEYPDQIVSQLGQEYFWNLMNDVIREPYIPKFEVTKYSKLRF